MLSVKKQTNKETNKQTNKKQNTKAFINNLPVPFIFKNNVFKFMHFVYLLRYTRISFDYFVSDNQ